MYKNNKILLVACCLNEENRIPKVCNRVPFDIIDEFLVIDDGSTDRTAEVAKNNGAKVISLNKIIGVGYGLKVAYKYALDNNFDIVVTIAGNNKDNPQEIPILLDPLIENDVYFVQGSRFLNKQNQGDIPLYRKFATRLHPLIFSIFTGKKVTESTNGFRAFKTKILNNSQINLDQDWLDKYELEPYLYYKTISLGYKTMEVPVTKVYPQKGQPYTKMRPFFDWWSILRPLILLKCKIRK